MQLCGLPRVAVVHADDQLLIDTQNLAEQGDSEAQFSLALMYDTGDPARQDPGQAVYWFTRAAEAGVAGACLYLGMKYEFGVQVDKDTAKARYWYEQAALKGWAQAAFMLANLHFNASPAEQVAGCAWITVARDQDFPQAEQIRQQHCADLNPKDAARLTQLTADIGRKISQAAPQADSR